MRAIWASGSSHSASHRSRPFMPTTTSPDDLFVCTRSNHCNVNYKGTAGKIKNDNMANDAFYQFLLEAFTNMHARMTNDASMDQRVNRDHVPYDVWERQGYLQTTEGNVVHYGYIEKFIERLGERFNIREIAFDRWGAVQMVQNLEGMGFTVVPFGQGFKDVSPPTKELMKLVLEQRIAHAGHPVLRWMMDNIYVRTDPAGNIKPDKEKSTEKIDGAVATIMALDRAIRCGNETGESVYDKRGILFL